MSIIQDILDSKAIKITPTRELVLKVFLDKNHALSLTDIEDDLPWSDRATIFRTLKTFEKSALLHQIDDGDKAKKYALCSDKCDFKQHEIHPHFHCEKCNKTLCLTALNIPIPSLHKAYKINSYALIIKGICPDCL